MVALAGSFAVSGGASFIVGASHHIVDQFDYYFDFYLRLVGDWC